MLTELDKVRIARAAERGIKRARRLQRSRIVSTRKHQRTKDLGARQLFAEHRPETGVRGTRERCQQMKLMEG
jgi:hypothetical protein